MSEFCSDMKSSSDQYQAVAPPSLKHIILHNFQYEEEKVHNKIFIMSQIYCSCQVFEVRVSTYKCKSSYGFLQH